MVADARPGPLDTLPLPAHITRLLSDALPVVARFIYDVFTVKNVQRIAFSADGVQFDLWVLLQTESVEDAKRIYAMEREHLSRLGAAPFDLHVVSLTRTAGENLPPLQTILER